MNINNNNTIAPSINERIIKYLLFGLVIAITVRYLPEKTIYNEEIILIGAIGSILFAIIDMLSPSIKLK
jgi:hypothetical protein